MHDALSYPPVWYLMRATGIVSLLLLTLVVALGVATERRAPIAGHRAVTHGIHRSASLLAVAFLGVHVLTAVIDPDAAVGLLSLLIPFEGSAHPFWVGLGALSLELVAALVVTSLLRRHLSRSTWKSIHWLAYAAWPLALIHGGMGTDAARPWMVAVDVACVASVGAALTWRLGVPRAPQRQAAIVSQSLVTSPRRVSGS